MTANTTKRPVLALSGGVGGAKLALGLEDLLPAGELHVLVNTGDDFEHLGLHISPDIDTLLYTLAGKANPSQGWGLEGESWHMLEALAQLGGETWFQLGDKDLATHLWRTHHLAAGDALTVVTTELASQLGVASRVHPMSADPVRTTVHCRGESLPFQRYFVEKRCQPEVTGFSFEGIGDASPNEEVMTLLRNGAFSQIVVCPSNPFVSIDPILQLPSLWQALADNRAPVTLVSPIVAGIAIKGPAAKMMAELGVPVTALGVLAHYCQHYPGLVNNFVIDESDATLASQIDEPGVNVVVTSTVMKTRDDKQSLARAVLDLVGG